jgi:hypothetical protein
LRARLAGEQVLVLDQPALLLQPAEKRVPRLDDVRLLAAQDEELGDLLGETVCLGCDQIDVAKLLVGGLELPTVVLASTSAVPRWRRRSATR